MTAEALSLPTILIRGRSVMALVVSPEWPLDDWLEALDAQMGRTKGLFGHRPVVAHLGAAPEGGRAAEYALDAIASRDLKVIGVDGLDPARLAGTRWARLPMIPQGRETILPGREARGQHQD